MKARMMTDKLQDWQKEVGRKARDVGRVTDEYVHDNTWTTVAFAAALGCIIGFLIGYRRD